MDKRESYLDMLTKKAHDDDLMSEKRYTEAFVANTKRGKKRKIEQRDHEIDDVTSEEDDDDAILRSIADRKRFLRAKYRF